MTKLVNINQQTNANKVIYPWNSAQIGLLQTGRFSFYQLHKLYCNQYPVFFRASSKEAD